ncbi:MAG: acyl-CoA dehydrogenase family protein [Melioribacteraceae bacterium]|nr:acyl-CoA dehydrogenase family protein [Melioribacteraceae bacterium]MCF8355299.1 acyl-CoA dehydrogenase family protein [Melioribacteraceae bacterium]MCF8394145.1 acyl-CoA dehydrogenase family protein [Melioribacteraceae bacterium]MCF8418116.1 acyl-CoA dehydrogenase family protein [Melioribacteraceae bacterium]
MAEETTKKKVLKGGEFLTKETDPQSIFIPEDINEEQKLMSQAADEFVEKEITPKLDAIDHQEEGLTESLLEKAGELGLLGTAVPEEFGGLGEDFNTNTFIAMAMGASHSFGVSFAAHTGIGTLPILYYGTEDQKKKYLPKFASGEWKSAYCLTEPTSGSDALSAKTTAVLTDDGSHYILNGQKMWITNGGFADVLITFAQVDGDKFTCFIIDTSSEGFTRGKEEDKMGIKGSSTRALFLENVKVPKENVLGEIGKGHYVAFNILNIGRFKLCAMTTGGAKKFISEAINYANERKQFGKPISSFGAIKHKLAEQAVRVFVSESATLRTSGLINNQVKELQEDGLPYSEAVVKSAEEYAIESAMLKVFGSEMLDYVVDEAVQIFGGYGYSEEYPAARAYRDSRINRIFEGTNEINRLLTVDMLVKRSMKGRLDLMGPAMAIQKDLMSIPDFGEKPGGLLVKELEAIKNAKKAILMIAGSAVQKFMQKLANEQEIIMNVTDMLIEVFTSESAILRTLKLAAVKSEAELQPYVNMTQVYVSDSMERINVYGKHAITSFAEADELKMLMLGMKRYTKLEPVNTKELRRNIADKLIETGKYCF